MKELVIILLAITLASAQQIGFLDLDDVYIYLDFVLSNFVIIIGLIMIFFGYRYYRFTLISSGFILFYFVFIKIVDAYSSLDLMWHYVIGVGCGIVGGLLFGLKIRIGSILFGAFTGFLLSAAILGATPIGELIELNWVHLVILLASGIVVALLGIWLQKTLAIGGSSFSGAYLVGTVLDDQIFRSTESTFLTSIFFYFEKYLDYKIDDWKPYVTLVIIVLFTVVGVVVQYKWTKPILNENGNEEEVPLTKTKYSKV